MPVIHNIKVVHSSSNSRPGLFVEQLGVIKSRAFGSLRVAISVFYDGDDLNARSRRRIALFNPRSFEWKEFHSSREDMYLIEKFRQQAEQDPEGVRNRLEDRMKLEVPSTEDLVHALLGEAIEKARIHGTERDMVAPDFEEAWRVVSDMFA